MHHAAVTIWGDGTTKREFLNVNDLADACLHLMENFSDLHIINIGTGKDLTVKESAETIAQIIGYAGEVEYDTSKPNGIPSKRLDVSRLLNLGWQFKVKLKKGIKETYDTYISSIL